MEEINHQIALLIELIIEEKVFMIMKKVSVLVEEHLYQEYNLHTHEEVTREEEVHLQEDMNQGENRITMMVCQRCLLQEPVEVGVRISTDHDPQEEDYIIIFTNRTKVPPYIKKDLGHGRVAGQLW